MLRGLGISICLSAFTLAAATDAEAKVDRLRDAAMARFEAHDLRGALALNRRAIRAARQLPETSWRVIENYDDAGLYYFALGQWKRSAQHQSVAVLLACGQPESADAFPVYMERLERAYTNYRPSEAFQPIQANPQRLLIDVRLNVRKFFDLRRRYFITTELPLEPGESRRRYRYRLRPDVACAPCAAPERESEAPASVPEP